MLLGDDGQSMLPLSRADKIGEGPRAARPLRDAPRTPPCGREPITSDLTRLRLILAQRVLGKALIYRAFLGRDGI